MPWTTMPGGGSYIPPGSINESDPVAVPLLATKADLVHTHEPGDINDNENARLVSDVDISNWNSKQDALGYTAEDISNKGAAGGYAGLDNSGLVPTSQLPANPKEIEVFNDIADRDAFVGTYLGLRCHVIDAFDDPSVATHTWAEYLWTGSAWTKTAEADSIDVILQWANITGKPTSTTAQLDNAVTQAHGVNSANTSHYLKSEVYTKTEADSLLSGKAATAHAHAESTITFTDILTNNSSITKHGYLPKLTGNSGHVLRGDGSWGGVDGSVIGAHTHVISDTGGLQAALDAKTAIGHTHVISDVTGLTAALSAKQDVITGAATTVVSSNLTADRAMITTSGGKITNSNVTTAELGYVSGVTSNIQIQFAGKANISHSHTISNISDWPVSVSATELGYLDGVTSAIQTQLNSKASTAVDTTNFTALASTDDTIQKAFDKIDDLLTGIETLLAAL